MTTLGEQLVTALNGGDPNTFVELVNEDAEPISVFGATTRGDLVDLFGWINASDWQFEPQACEPSRVECTVLLRTGDGDRGVLYDGHCHPFQSS